MKLLRIDSSARKSSVTRQLTQKFVETWKRTHPDGDVVVRDLATTSLPSITDEWVQAAHSEPAKWTPEQRKAIALSEELVGEVLGADTILIGAPMYNFSISALLKGWIDHLARMGKTFTYSAKGPEGLVKGKKVVVLTARGGAYKPGSFTEKFDHQEPYLRFVLGFLGMTDVTFIHAETQLSPDAKGPALDAAMKEIEALAVALPIKAAAV